MRCPDSNKVGSLCSCKQNLEIRTNTVSIKVFLNIWVLKVSSWHFDKSFLCVKNLKRKTKLYFLLTFLRKIMWAEHDTLRVLTFIRFENIYRFVYKVSTCRNQILIAYIPQSLVLASPASPPKCAYTTAAYAGWTVSSGLEPKIKTFLY